MIPTFAFLSFAFYVSPFTRTKRQTSTFESSYSREASVPASGSFFNCLINISTLCDEKERVVCSSTRERHTAHRHIGFARAGHRESPFAPNAARCRQTSGRRTSGRRPRTGSSSAPTPRRKTARDWISRNPVSKARPRRGTSASFWRGC